MDDNNQGGSQLPAGDGNAPSEQQAPDAVGNLKAEFHRKFSNVDESLQRTNAALESVLQEIRQRQAAPQTPEKSVRELMYEDPDKAAAIIEERATQKATQVIGQRIEATQATQNAVVQLQQRYPEFAQSNSEAANLALEKFKTLPKHLQGTPEGARMVMLEAAADLGLMPIDKRRQSAQAQSASDDSYVTPGSGRSGQQAQPRQPSANDIPKETLAMAQLLGRDINDPKVLEGLRQASQRKSWGRYS